MALPLSRYIEPALRSFLMVESDGRVLNPKVKFVFLGSLRQPAKHSNVKELRFQTSQMADQLDDDRDEEWFKEVYGTEYTGPTKGARDTRKVEPPPAKPTNKRTTTNPSDSEEDDEPRDPNAVPTDFTSREAKVWEAKAKAVERNWKRRKEEELTCRLCGEVGHFAQVCTFFLHVAYIETEEGESAKGRSGITKYIQRSAVYLLERERLKEERDFKLKQQTFWFKCRAVQQHLEVIENQGK